MGAEVGGIVQVVSTTLLVGVVINSVVERVGPPVMVFSLALIEDPMCLPV